MKEEYQSPRNAIFWVEVGKINPNPYQPRREFDEARLNDLADSIRQYGVLQPLVVTRKEQEREDGGIEATYELIAGERRLRAAERAGVSQLPVIIRESTSSEENERMKLEIAIIENIQREDLTPVDRARAFRRLVDEFGFKHGDIAKKVGKSRMYVTNSLRVLTLPEEIIDALASGKLAEGHARPLLMLSGKDAEQMTLYKEILQKQLTVRDAERIARRIAKDRVRNKKEFDPELMELEKQFTNNLGTRVQIERRDVGGKLMIEFATTEDLKSLLGRIQEEEKERSGIQEEGDVSSDNAHVGEMNASTNEERADENVSETAHNEEGKEDTTSEEDNLYSVRNFNI